MSTTHRNRRLAGAIATTLALAGALTLTVTAASAHDDHDGGWWQTKRFTVAIDGTTAGAAPQAFAGDADATIRITITNRSREQRLGSANVTVPAPFALVRAVGDAVPGGPVIELRNLGLRPGESTTVTATVDVRTCTAVLPRPFLVAAKQSNDFRGWGNDLALAAPSDLWVGVTGRCQLQLLSQPTDARRDTAITTAALDPSAAPLQVRVVDAGLTGTATSSRAAVALQAANPSIASPAVGGTASAAAVAGIATFSPGPTLATSATGYTFTATSRGLVASAPSDGFAIVDDAVGCGAGDDCSRPATATKGGSSVSVSFTSGANAVTLVLSIGAPDAPLFECADYPQPAGTSISGFTFTGGSAADRIGTYSQTIPDASPSVQYQACWAAPYPFTTRSGYPATVQGTKPGTGEPLYVGTLPNCGVVIDTRPTPRSSSSAYDDVYGSSPPCVASRSFDPETNTATVTVTATGDDPWRY